MILARAGSKGISNKNLQVVGKSKLLERAIHFASNSCDEVIVSSDGEEILSLAQSLGAKAAWRPIELSGDEVSSEQVIENVIREYALENDIVVFIQCTSPFQDDEALRRAIDLVAEEKFDSVFSAVKSHGFIWEVEQGGGAKPLLAGANPRMRRQDLNPRFLESGAFYVFKAQKFMEEKTRFNGTVGLVETDVLSSIEIDEPADLLLAQKISELEKSPGVLEKFLSEKCKLLAYDFDGVMTDNKVSVNEDGKESVQVSRADGLAIAEMLSKGLSQVIVTTETNDVVRRRAEKLRLPILERRKQESSA